MQVYKHLLCPGTVPSELVFRCPSRQQFQIQPAGALNSAIQIKDCNCSSAFYPIFNGFTEYLVVVSLAFCDLKSHDVLRFEIAAIVISELVHLRRRWSPALATLVSELIDVSCILEILDIGDLQMELAPLQQKRYSKTS